MTKKWIIRDGANPKKVNDLKTALKVDRIVAELLVQRGIETFDEAKKFFRPELTDLHDPFLMKDMDKAVQRIEKALNNKEKILVFGDYDVDGTTAVSLLYLFLKKYFPTIDYYIPDRYSEGYGLSFQGIDYAVENQQTLLIALDCGVKAMDKVAYANEKGVDVIVCDHHQPGEELPACIVLDPKRVDCAYPYKELSGCGVGFKLMQACCAKMNWSQEDLFRHLDLLAVSIGADIVPVTGENRILCFHGLKQLNANPRMAFKEVIELAARKFPLSLTDVVFTIAPRINAAGRLYTGKHAVELMVSEDMEEIERLARDIQTYNQERRELDTDITAEALEMLQSDPSNSEKCSTVVYSPDWHKGVVGIVASRLIETYYRPTIVLTKSGETLTGSARSVENFDLYEALEACQEHLIQFGGHKHAAGLTLHEHQLSAFKKRFEEVVQSKRTTENKQPILEIDLQIDLNEIHGNEPIDKIPRLKRIIEEFEPHGPGNMKPIFHASNLYANDSRILKEEHLKLKVVQPNSKYAYDAIGFRMADKEMAAAQGVPFEMLFTLETNEYNGRKSIQMNIKDLRTM
jgi:single-stranded-DNA-specific exonuclease